MNNDHRRAAERHYQAAGSWAEDALAGVRRSRRTAWIVAIVATGVAAIEALSIWAMLPLRTVVPYTLMVDRHTGYVAALRPLEAGLLVPDAALTQSFLVQYVLAREGYDRATIRQDYQKVALWSAEMARRQYVTAMAATNPASPVARLGAQARIDVQVRSVSPLGQDSALVRFETQIADQERPVVTQQYWVALLRYRFSREPMATEDRFINPLGFQVLSYRRSPETLPSQTSPAGTVSSAQARSIVASPNGPRPTAGSADAPQ
jgi:type IV secretion system protein VirB8